MTPCLLLLDLDDTLIATRETAWRKSVLAAARLHLPTPSWTDFCAVYGHRSFEECIRMLYGESALVSFPQVYASLDLQVKPRQLAQPGTLAVLERAVGFIGILSNSPHFKVARKLKVLKDDASLFSWVFHRDNLPALKPSVAVLPSVAETCGCDVASIIFVGDSVSDSQTVLGSDAKFIGVTTGIASRDDFQDAGVSRANILPSINELYPLLLKLEVVSESRQARQIP